MDKNIDKGIYIVAVLQVVLAILRLLNVIECSWLVVFAPTLISGGLLLILAIVIIKLDLTSRD